MDAAHLLVEGAGGSTVRGAALGTAVAIGCIALAVVPGKAQLAGVILAPVMLLLTWRSWSTGIRVDDKGVKVVTTLLSKRFPWSYVDHFEVRPLD